MWSSCTRYILSKGDVGVLFLCLPSPWNLTKGRAHHLSFSYFSSSTLFLLFTHTVLGTVSSSPPPTFSLSEWSNAFLANLTTRSRSRPLVSICSSAAINKAKGKRLHLARVCVEPVRPWAGSIVLRRWMWVPRWFHPAQLEILDILARSLIKACLPQVPYFTLFSRASQQMRKRTSAMEETQHASVCVTRQSGKGRGTPAAAVARV